MKIRFYGNATPATREEDYGTVEKKALNEGLLFMRGAAQELRKWQLASDELAGQPGISDAVVRTSYIFSTEYASNGGVRIFLENSLAKALQRSDITFKMEKPPAFNKAACSGIVFHSRSFTKPRAFYRVVNEAGEVLFEAKDLAKEAFQRNLMGSWFINPTHEDITKVIGAKTVSLAVEVKDSDFVVQQSAWDDATRQNRALLENARIVIALPEATL